MKILPAQFPRALRYLLLTAGLALWAAPTAVAAAAPDLTVAVITDRRSYRPGDTATIALKVEIPAQYHLYGNPMGPGIGKPLTISLGGPSGVTWIDVRKTPAGQFQPIEGDWVWAYTKETTFFLRGIIGSGAEGVLDGQITLRGLICATACIPVEKKIGIAIAVNPAKKTASVIPFGKVFEKTEPFVFSTEPFAGEGRISPVKGSIDLAAFAAGAVDTNYRWDYEPRENRVELNFFIALFFAFIAGIILNVMPCVLPVLGIKILSFSEGVAFSRHAAVMRSLAFSAGMMAVFMVLATFAAFAEYSWGQQFQNPKVLIAIIAVIFIFALGMFDIYTILLPPGVGNLERKAGEGMWGDFVRGMFATVLATPCSGPFLGATLAWTLTQKPLIIYLIFFAVGAGMAFPYILFSSSKQLARHIPKPGPWMNDFKHLMGILLFGFAVYLMTGLPQDMIAGMAGFCVALTFAVLLFVRTAPFGSSWRRKTFAGILVLAIVSGGILVNFRSLLYHFPAPSSVPSGQSAVAWVDFSPRLLSDAHARGQHVLIDFTANWCMNCQYNKVAILDSKPVGELMLKKNILVLKADLTGNNKAAESLLHSLGSRSIPFLAIFPGDDPYKPIIMRDILDKKKLERALKDLADK